MFKRAKIDTTTGDRIVEEYTDAEAIALGLRPSDAEIAAQIEAEVQETADELLEQGQSRDRALALATVDLAMAAADGQLAGRTRAQVRGVFRDKIVEYLRAQRTTV